MTAYIHGIQREHNIYLLNLLYELAGIYIHVMIHTSPLHKADGGLSRELLILMLQVLSLFIPLA